MKCSTLDSVKALLDANASVFACDAETKAAEYSKGCAPWQDGYRQHSIENLAGALDFNCVLGLWPESIELVVVDVDGTPAQVMDRFEYVCSTIGVPLGSVRSRSGGWHIYYRRGDVPKEATADRAWRMPNGEVGGDVRGSNGYVILWDAKGVSSMLSNPEGVLDPGRWMAFLSTKAPVVPVEVVDTIGAGSVLPAKANGAGAHPVMRAEVYKAVGAGKPIDEAAWAQFLLEEGKNRRTVGQAEAEVARARAGAELKVGRPVVEPPPFERPQIHEKPIMPERRGVPVSTGDDVAKLPTKPCTPGDVAEYFICREGENWVLSVEDDTWFNWRDGRGYRKVGDKSRAALMRAIGRVAEAVWHTPDRKTMKLMPNRIAGGSVSQARIAGFLPAYKGMAYPSAMFDTHPSLLGLADGMVVDLATGEIREVKRSDFVTIHTPFPPAPLEGSYIERLLPLLLLGDDREYFERAIGSFLFGVPMLRILLFVPGDTGRGKSLLIRFIEEALGEYATTWNAGSVTTRSKGFDVDNLNAMLRGRRVATVDELHDNQLLAPSRMNQISGSTRLVSRIIQGNMLATESTHSTLWAFNDLPGVDVKSSPKATAAFFDRLRIVRFSHRLDAAVAREGYQQALHDPREVGAVLQWLLDCSAKFREHGEAAITTKMMASAEEYWQGLHTGEKSY